MIDCLERLAVHADSRTQGPPVRSLHAQIDLGLGNELGALAAVGDWDDAQDVRACPLLVSVPNQEIIPITRINVQINVATRSATKILMVNSMEERVMAEAS